MFIDKIRVFIKLLIKYDFILHYYILSLYRFNMYIILLVVFYSFYKFFKPIQIL